MARHIVCDLDDLRPGALTTAKLGRSSIVLSLLPDGAVRAFSGRCPHQGADLSQGCIENTVRSDAVNELEVERRGEVLRCPWHGFEFSLIDGSSLVPASESMPLKLRLYDVEIDDGKVVVLT